MEMPETLKSRSKVILSEILAAFDIPEDTPFEDLIKKLDKVPFTREETLNNANARLTSLLNSEANTHVKLHN